jgi:hypothetical protein
MLEEEEEELLQPQPAPTVPIVIKTAAAAHPVAVVAITAGGVGDTRLTTAQV